MSEETRPPFTAEEALRTWESIKDTPPRDPPGVNGHGDGVHADHGTTFRLTDSDNARRFAAKFGDVYRYDVMRKVYMHWTGIKWTADDHQAQEDAKTIAVDLFKEAQAMPNGTDEEKKARTAAFSWAKSSGMGPHIREMLRMAQSIPRLKVPDVEMWDANDVLIGFPNGYLDLRTGAFRDPWPEAMITQVAGAPRDTAARDDRWDATLERFLPDPAVRRDFQVAMGYSWGGRGKEHMFNAHGPTKCGKSTIIGAIRNALGDYAGAADIESFTASHTTPGKGGTRSDLAALVGKRLVVASEASERQRISPTTIKQVLGGSDKIPARELYGKQFEFLPRFVLWLLTNELPRIPGDDAAMWERIHVFKFDQYIAPQDRDPTERDKLQDPARAGSAILAWIEEGWWAHIADMKAKRGLYLPTTVEATAVYRTSQDYIAQFIAEGCEVGETFWCTVAMFKAYFRAWLEEEKVHEPYSDIRIGKALEERGFSGYIHPQLKVRCRRGLRVTGMDETPPGGLHRRG
jgi:putative DNA primase/helicase